MVVTFAHPAAGSKNTNNPPSHQRDGGLFSPPRYHSRLMAQLMLTPSTSCSPKFIVPSDYAVVCESSPVHLIQEKHPVTGLAVALYSWTTVYNRSLVRQCVQYIPDFQSSVPGRDSNDSSHCVAPTRSSLSALTVLLLPFITFADIVLCNQNQKACHLLHIARDDRLFTFAVPLLLTSPVQFRYLRHIMCCMIYSSLKG